MTYVGTGHGEYMQETTYRYVGYGGDFDQLRSRRDFTCVITGCCLLSLLLLLPLLLWLLWPGTSTSAPIDCRTREVFSPEKAEYCCMNYNVGCLTTSRATLSSSSMPPPPTPMPTQPTTIFTTLAPTPATTPGRPVDPFNCAVDPMTSWIPMKKAWCCRIHHLGCPTVAPTMPPVAPPPADPYNCAEGFANWMAGWSVDKKAWCCAHHGKGCPQAGGCATTSPPFDCNAGFANWQAGWSVAKKAWCCQHASKGCPPAAGGCA